MRTVRLLLLAAALPWAACAATDTGRVIAVAKGDTLTVLAHERERVRVRLLGIDAPEPTEDFGRPSQTSLAALAMGKDVRLEGDKKDGQGYTVARVWVGDPACREADCPKSVDVGLAQVAAGMAWQDPLYGKQLPAADRQRYEEAEFMAKIRRLGLWAGKSRRFPLSGQQRRLDE